MADKKDKRTRTPATAAALTLAAEGPATAATADNAEAARSAREGKGAGKTSGAQATPAPAATPASPLLVDQAAPGIGAALVAEAAAASKRKRGKKGEKADAAPATPKWRKPRTAAAVAEDLAAAAAAPLVEGKGVGEALVSGAEPRRRGRPRNPPLAPGEKPVRARPTADKPRRRYQPGRQRVPPGYLVTGVRVDERLSPMLLALARANGQDGGRSASLTSIACAAMRTFAGLNGIELSEVEISASRRDDDVLGDRASRRLWVKYPEAWKTGLDELMRLNPALNHTADLWRSALVEFARASGVAA